MRKYRLFLFVLLILGTFSGCGNNGTLESISLKEGSKVDYQINATELTDFTVYKEFSSGVIESLPLSETMISDEDLELLEQVGNHNITLTVKDIDTTVTFVVYETMVDKSLITIYMDVYEMQDTTLTYEEWLDTIKGEDGVGIDSISINDVGHLIIVYDDGSTEDAGQVSGVAQAADGYYLVNFYGIEGFIISSQLVAEGSSAVMDEYTAPNGYVFDGWDQEFDEVTMQMDIHPNFHKIAYTVSFVTHTDDVEDDLENVEYNQTITLPYVEKEGHTFLGWYLGEDISSELFTYNSKVTSNLTVHALWEPQSYDVEYMTYYNTTVSLGSYQYGEEVDLPMMNLSDNIVIDGWYTDMFYNTLFDFSSMPADDVILYAKYYQFDYTIYPDSELGDVVIIHDYIGDYNHVNVPSYINDLPVYEIGTNAFKGANFQTITLPETLQIIGFSAFMECINLESIEIPDSVTSIGNFAFRDNASLQSVVLPSSLTVISTGLFYNAPSLTSINIPEGVTVINTGAFFMAGFEHIELPSSLVYIGDYAFQSSSLIDIVIPEGVTEIKQYTFFGNSNLQSVTIPSTIHTIYPDAFQYDEALEYIYVDEGNEDFISDEGVLYTAGYDTLILYPSAKSSIAYSIPTSTTTIEDLAFSNVLYLQNLTMPSSVSISPDGNFFDCNDLVSFTTFNNGNPTKYVSVDGVLFTADMTVLMKYPAKKTGTSYSTPNTVLEVKYRSFEHNQFLESVTLNEGLLEIGMSAFSNAVALQEIILPSTLIHILDKAFEDADELISIYILENVTYISKYAFKDCDSLSAITVDSSNTTYDSIGGVLYNEGATSIIIYPAGKTASEVIIISSVVLIGEASFEGNDYLETLIIPSTVEVIESYAFIDMDSLSRVEVLTKSSDPLIDIHNLSFRKVPQVTVYFYSEVYQDYIDLLNSTYYFVETTGVLPE